MYRFQNHDLLVWNITPTLLVYNLMQTQISLVQNSQTNWQTAITRVPDNCRVQIVTYNEISHSLTSLNQIYLPNL